MAQALDKQILDYLPLLGSEEKKSLLSVIRSFLSLKEEEATERISIEQYNQELDAALTRTKSGEFFTQEEAERQASEW